MFPSTASTGSHAAQAGSPLPAGLIERTAAPAPACSADDLAQGARRFIRHVFGAGRPDGQSRTV